MKTILTLALLFLTFSSFSQDISREKAINKLNYSKNSEIKVIYSDNSSKFHSNQNPAGVFVNEIFIGSQEEVVNFVNPDKIENVKIEKEKFEINGTAYYGKIIIKMKSDYNPKFVTLKGISTKYLKLNENPIIYQVDEKIIDNSNNEILVDENFILKIIAVKIKTSENTEINLIKFVTKTPENIKKANEIRIKGKVIK